MIDEVLAFQLVRPDDLLVLGVVLRGFDRAEPVGGIAAARAGPQALVKLQFPPQHVLEEPAQPMPADVWDARGGRIPPGAPLTAVQAQGNGWVDLFAIDDAGRLAWRPGHPRGSWGWFVPGPFARGSTLAAVSRAPEMIDVYAVDVSGALITDRARSLDPGPGSGFGTSSQLRTIDTGFDPLTPLAAVSRGPQDVDIFSVKGGQAWHVWQWPNGTYQAESRGGSFAPGSTISAVALDAGRVDIFGTNTETGSVDWAFWVDGEPWSQFESIGAPGGPLAPGTFVGAVARPGIGIDVFVVGADEHVYTNTWLSDGGWLTTDGDWRLLGGDFPPGAPITAISRSPDAIDLVGVDWRARAQSATAAGGGWSTGWCKEGWVTLGEWFPPGSPVAAVGVSGRSELFAVGADRAVHHVSSAGVVDCVGPAGAASEGAAYFADIDVRRARLSRLTNVVFRVPEHTLILLTASGVLEALNDGTILPAVDEWHVVATRLAIPYGLTVTPVARSGASSVTCEHPAGTSQPGSVNGVWRTALRARDVDPGATDAGLVLDAVVADDGDDGLYDLALDASKRQSIAADAARGLRPDVRQLELSALGATFRVGDGFEWELASVLGRDQHVRTVREGVLYPLGHRAEYVEVTERIVDPRAPRSVAALRKKRTLFVTERVRGAPSAPTLRRRFPFAEVEITAGVFADLAAPEWIKVPRPTAALVAIDGEIAALRREADALRPQVATALSHVATFDELLAAGFPAAFELSLLWPRITALQNQIAELAAGRTFDAVLAQQLAQLTADEANLEAALDAAARPPADIHALRDADLPESAAAGRLIELDELIAAKSDERDTLIAGGAEHIDFFFQPQTPDGARLQFPVRCAGGNGDLHLSLPLIFVSDELQPPLLDLVDVAWASTQHVELPGVGIDLVHAAPRTQDAEPGAATTDVHEVHAIRIGCEWAADGPRPRLDELLVGLPAARGLLDDAAAQAPHAVRFSEQFVAVGEAHDVLLEFVAADGLSLDFAKQAQRAGALVAPVFNANRISRSLGLVNALGTVEGAAGALDPAKVFDAGASLLGFPLKDVLGSLGAPPTLTSLQRDGEPPAVRMHWGIHPQPPVHLSDSGPLETGVDGRPSTVELSVERSPQASSTTCSLRNFALALPRAKPTDERLLRVIFASLTYTQVEAREPHLDIDGLKLEFLGDLRLLEDLRKEAQRLLGFAGASIDATAHGVRAGYAIEIPDAAAGAFNLSNIAFTSTVVVPFAAEPVSVELSFASRRRPFNLSVLAFGGGGYVVVVIDHTGIREIDAAFEFGASVRVNFFVATGEVHALGGARYKGKLPDGRQELTGYLRMGGSVRVLGLVSVSIELVLTMTYRARDNALVGRATIVVEIDLTLFSDSIEIDSGDWVLVGGSSTDEAGEPATLEDWRRYRSAFAA